MTFFNIFSNKKGKESKKQKQKPKIIIDNREKNSLVLSELINLGFQTELKQLEVADYLINNIAIERKSINDLQSSIINKRIFSQLRDLKQYKQKVLIVEGEIDYNSTFIHENALRGFLISAALDYKTPIIFTKDEKDTAKYLSVLAKKTENKESSLRESITFKTEKEQIQYILEGFPGIGPKTAEKLLKHFKTLANLFNAPLEKIIEIGGKKAESVYRLINYK